MEVLIEILSENRYLLQNKGRLVGSLGISGAAIDPHLKLFDLGHSRPYDLLKVILSEWISIKKDSATIAELRRILREQNFHQLSDKLKNLEGKHPGPMKPELSIRNDPLQTTKWPITFGLKRVVQNFTGREEELGRLNQYFHSGSPIVLITGLGGIGKTELARKFALDTDNTRIVKSWLCGENAQSLLSSTSEFCHELQLPLNGKDGQPLGMQEMVQNIFKKLKSSGEFSRWVIIIDNVDDIYEEFETALKTLSAFTSDAFFLLITSRRIDIFPGELKLLEVRKMPLPDSMALVRTSLEISDDSSDEAIKFLCKQLDNFPLALNQAVAFILEQQVVTLKRRAYSIQNYLEELTRNQKLGLDKDRKLGNSTATLAVWNITIDKISQDYGTEGQLALDLLDAMAFINPDDIPIPLLHKLYLKFYVEEITFNQMKSSLTLLQNYSLISSYNEVLAIHRLVQLALRDRMSSKSPSENLKPPKYIEMLTNFWISLDEEECEEWYTIDWWIGNILTIWNHTTKQKVLDEHRTVKILKVSRQLDTFGKVQVSEAYNFAIECSQFLIELEGLEQSENKEYLNMELCLVIALKDKGQYEAALKEFTALYRELKKLRVSEDVRAVATGYWITAVLNDLKRFEDSLEWGEKVLQYQIRIYGEKSAIVIKTRQVVAKTLDELQKGTEAVEILNEMLAQAKEATRNNCDFIKWFKGVGLFEQREKEVLPCHPDTRTPSFGKKCWSQLKNWLGQNTP